MKLIDYPKLINAKSYSASDKKQIDEIFKTLSESFKNVTITMEKEMGKVFRYPNTYFDNETGKPYYLQEDADDVVDELRKEIKILEEDVDYYKDEVKNAYVPGNALYQTIVKRVEPFFPKDTRELEWDVLPGTIYKLAKENAQMKELLMKLNFEVSEIVKNMRD